MINDDRREFLSNAFTDNFLTPTLPKKWKNSSHREENETNVSSRWGSSHSFIAMSLRERIDRLKGNAAKEKSHLSAGATSTTVLSKAASTTVSQVASEKPASLSGEGKSTEDAPPRKFASYRERIQRIVGHANTLKDGSKHGLTGSSVEAVRNGATYNKGDNRILKDMRSSTQANDAKTLKNQRGGDNEVNTDKHTAYMRKKIGEEKENQKQQLERGDEAEVHAMADVSTNGKKNNANEVSNEFFDKGGKKKGEKQHRSVEKNGKRKGKKDRATAIDTTETDNIDNDDLANETDGRQTKKYNDIPGRAASTVWEGMDSTRLKPSTDKFGDAKGAKRKKKGQKDEGISNKKLDWEEPGYKKARKAATDKRNNEARKFGFMDDDEVSENELPLSNGKTELNKRITNLSNDLSTSSTATDISRRGKKKKQLTKEPEKYVRDNVENQNMVLENGGKGKETSKKSREAMEISDFAARNGATTIERDKNDKGATRSLGVKRAPDYHAQSLSKFYFSKTQLLEASKAALDNIEPGVACAPLYESKNPPGSSMGLVEITPKTQYGPVLNQRGFLSCLITSCEAKKLKFDSGVREGNPVKCKAGMQIIIAPKDVYGFKNESATVSCRILFICCEEFQAVFDASEHIDATEKVEDTQAEDDLVVATDSAVTAKSNRHNGRGDESDSLPKSPVRHASKGKSNSKVKTLNTQNQEKRKRRRKKLYYT